MYTHKNKTGKEYELSKREEEEHATEKKEKERRGGLKTEGEKERESERQNSVHIPGSPALKLYFHLVIFQGNLGGPPKVLDILMHFSSFTYTQPL